MPSSTLSDSEEDFSGLISGNLTGAEVSGKSWQTVVCLLWGLQVQPGQPFLQQMFQNLPHLLRLPFKISFDLPDGHVAILPASSNT